MWRKQSAALLSHSQVCCWQVVVPAGWDRRVRDGGAGFPLSDMPGTALGSTSSALLCWWPLLTRGWGSRAGRRGLGGPGPGRPAGLSSLSFPPLPTSSPALALSPREASWFTDSSSPAPRGCTIHGGAQPWSREESSEMMAGGRVPEPPLLPPASVCPQGLWILFFPYQEHQGSSCPQTEVSLPSSSGFCPTPAILAKHSVGRGVTVLLGSSCQELG